jgi:hypothetical protein
MSGGEGGAETLGCTCELIAEVTRGEVVSC